MIDLKAARSDPDGWRAALARKGGAEDFDRLLEADERWRSLVPRVDELRTRTKLKGKPTPEELAALKPVKAELKQVEEELAAAEADRNAALALVPNPPHESAPDGDTEEDAVEIRRSGEPPKLESPREHTEVGRFDMERAARVSGARFGYVVGDTALVAMALYRFALDHLVEAGFTPVIPPVLVREEAMYGTGFFPTDRSNIYALEADGLFLTGTSEVALAALHTGEILETLPLHYTGFSTCFRREAGAAGKDTRGIFRLHQFDKVEMFSFVEPGASGEEHERLLAIQERILGALEIPYRVVDVAVGDLGAPAARKFDCEAWIPSQGRFREVTSCSNTTDYQARRLSARYRPARGESPEPVHTLNGTAVAVGRTLIALLENGQRENGSVELPAALQEFGVPERIPT